MKKIKYFTITLISAVMLSGFNTYKSDFFEIAKQIEIFTALYKEINMNYVDEVNPAELMDVAITNMLNDLDPYTNFYNEQDVEDARINKSASYANLGLELKKQEDRVVITDITKSFAADESGLKLGDEILSIDGTDVSNFADNLGEVLNGTPNTSVNLEVNRQGKNISVELKRSLNRPTSVPYFGMADEKTGYIVLSKFSRKASLDVGLALLELKDQGAEQIILDLRKNPGGLLSEAVNVSNLFLPKDQLITYTKSQIEDYNLSYATKNEPIDTEIPLTVLINERSASASEIVSGSLQDLDRAVIIGARSFGKGLVQRPKPLKYGTQVKITISRYYLPSGRGIQALEYKDGKSIRKSIENSKAFQTKNGRTVYDGGGIKPDVEIEAEEISDFTQNLIDDLMIFSFATKFAYDHPDLDWKNFVVDDRVYKSFVNYIEEKNYDIKVETDDKLNAFITSAENDNLDPEFVEDLKDLKADLKAEKMNLFNTYKTQISALLTDHIIKHYAFDEGVYQHNLQNAEVIKQAKDILNNEQTYHKILGM
jgi:carboxyl-terminal processing protease